MVHIYKYNTYTLKELMIKLKALLTEATEPGSDFAARSKETGRIVYYKSKENMDSAIKAGKSEKLKDKGESSKSDNTKPEKKSVNIFDKEPKEKSSADADSNDDDSENSSNDELTSSVAFGLESDNKHVKAAAKAMIGKDKKWFEDRVNRMDDWGELDDDEREELVDSIVGDYMDELQSNEDVFPEFDEDDEEAYDAFESAEEEISDMVTAYADDLAEKKYEPKEKSSVDNAPDSKGETGGGEYLSSNILEDEAAESLKNTMGQDKLNKIGDIIKSYDDKINAGKYQDLDDDKFDELDNHFPLDDESSAMDYFNAYANLMDEAGETDLKDLLSSQSDSQSDSKSEPNDSDTAQVFRCDA